MQINRFIYNIFFSYMCVCQLPKEIERVRARACKLLHTYLPARANAYDYYTHTRTTKKKVN